MAINVGQHSHVQGTAGGTSFTTGGVNTSASGSSFMIFAIAGSTTTSITSVTDNKSNTYSTLRSQTSAGGTKIFLALVENGIGGTGHTATVNISDGVATLYFIEVTGGALSSLVDQSVAFVDDASSPFTTTVTGTTAQADELALAFYATNTPSGTETITWGGSPGAFTQIDADGDSAFVTGGVAKLILSATGTVQGSITSSVATSAFGAVITLKQASGGGGPVLMGQVCL